MYCALSSEIVQLHPTTAAHKHIATNAAKAQSLILMEGLGAPRVGGLASSTVEGLGLSSRVEGLGLSTMEGLAPKMRGWPEQPYYYPYYKDPAQGI